MEEVNKKEGYRSILEMGPLLLFFGVNYFYGIIAGTAVLVISTLLSLGLSWYWFKNIPMMAAAGCVAVVLFGGLTIFFDDTESLFYKKLKNFSLSVNNDAIDKFVKKFFYNNSHQISYTKYFKGSGLSEFNKLSKLGSKPIFTNNVWEYNFIIARIYLTVKKILYIVKSKDKKDSNIQ